MKKIVWIGLIAGCLGMMPVFGTVPPEESTGIGSSAADTLSYAMGRLIGASLMRSEGADKLAQELNRDLFLEAVSECLDGKSGRMNEQEAYRILQRAQERWRREETEALKQAGEAFLDANRKQPGVRTTSSGLQYRVEKKGEGPKPTPQDVVRIYYTMKRTDGTVIDSSEKQGRPMDTPLGNLIPGVIEGMQLMPLGAKYVFYLPSKLAYGSQGAGEMVRPDETLIFEVELFDIEAGAAASGR